jgi:hypothetical protein
MNSEKNDAGNRFSFSNAQRYLLSTPDNSRREKVLEFFFWACILVILGWLFYFAIVTIVMPYQIEYREGAAQVMTQILLKGGNPFSSENQPLAFNNYGVAYNLVVLPLAALFGNTLLVHRGVTLFFIVLSCLLIFQTLFRVNHDFLFAAAGAILVLMGVAGRGGFGAFPSAMGEFLFLAVILIPVFRSFDFLSLCLSAVLGVIAFYTKPYFVLSFGIVATYLFIFVSKKKGLLYGLLFVALFIFSYFVVRYFYKYYFVDTVLSNLNQTSDASWGHVSDQLLEAAREFHLSIILAAAMLLLSFTKFHLKNISIKELFSRLNFLNMDRPLVNQPLNYFVYFLALSSSAFILILGQNGGSYMNYLYQIVLPPFYLVLFQGIKSSSRLGLISFFLIMLNIISFGWFRFNPGFLQQAYSPEWATLYQYVDGSKRVLNTPIVTSELVRVGIAPVDSGHTEYYFALQPYANNKLLGPNYDVVKQNGEAYKNLVRRSMIDGEYSYIIMNVGNHIFMIGDRAKYYSLIQTLTIPMPQVDQQWTVEIWKPINK